MKNPYNFSLPVKDINYLFGRTNELMDIRYYLAQGNLTNQPISIALIGERASGKTSLLYGIQNIAEELSYISVRIDLNETDVESDNHFFHKVIDELIFTICENGSFGGLQGKFYDNYIDILTGNNPQDNTCNLLFPKLYGKLGDKKGNPISDSTITRDLNSIRSSIGKNIIFLIDEANLISKNLSILQKLRNILMRINGYSIILAGTESIFPSMDEVFSPIARQFFRIQVGPFKDFTDTAECVLRPLESSDETSHINISESTIREIHSMTFGKPFEIQFVCHNLFKSAIENSSEELKINRNSIKSISDQLVNLSARENKTLLNNITNLSSQEFKILSTIQAYENGISEFMLLSHLKVFNSFSSQEIARSKEQLGNLIDKGVLVIKDEKILFSGDAFETVYLKYTSTLEDTDFHPPQNIEEVWFLKLSDILMHNLSNSFNRYLVYSGSKFSEDVNRITRIINSNRSHELSNTQDLKLLRAVYEMAYDLKNGARPQFIQLNLKLSDLDLSVAYVLKEENSNKLEEIGRRIEKYKQIIIGLGGRLYYTIDTTQLPQRNNLPSAVIEAGDKKFINSIADFHEDRIYNYNTQFQERSARVMELHTQTIMKYSQHLDGEYNNLGYMLIKIGRANEAIDILKISLDNISSDDRFRRSIVNYNLAIGYYETGKIVDAIKTMEASISYSRNLARVRRECACLLKYNTETRKLEEISENADLLIFGEDFLRFSEGE
ncbi:type IV pilus biogenesis/stability protein PilW [Deinococcus sp. RIT780]|uniref:tetratricopeptide repeat protein n=1 Tax=Deinococcus sp. RIT780 TaxID=2870472 RepID=UPI001C8901CD|nr:hypothetical protein [Deinococcus sp. RIT780]MBX8464769.1 hypothetical protein [Deinococcus sp. RIT780]